MKLIFLLIATLAAVYGQSRWVNQGGFEEIREIEYLPGGEERIIDILILNFMIYKIMIYMIIIYRSAVK